jgi:IS1 family transposase
VVVGDLDGWSVFVNLVRGPRFAPLRAETVAWQVRRLRRRFRGELRRTSRRIGCATRTPRRYRSPLRARVEQLRADQRHTPRRATAPQPEADPPASQSNVVRTLTAQLADLKRHHRAEIARLETALAAAQGENLQLRRHLGRQHRPPAA